jgi:hypothetical protein
MSNDMRDYDPLKAPDPTWWLSLDEDDRNSLILEYHRRARVKLPNARAHAAFHAIVETQVAMGDELPVARTLARLQSEGLDRHDAVHAIGSVLAEGVYAIMGGEKASDPNQAYWAALERLSAKSWRVR